MSNDVFCFVLFKTSGHILQRLDQHSRHVGTCAFSKSGHFLTTGSNDRTVAIWTSGHQPDHSGFTRFSDSREESSRLNVMAGKSDAVLIQTVVSHLSDVNALVFIDDSQVELMVNVDQN